MSQKNDRALGPVVSCNVIHKMWDDDVAQSLAHAGAIAVELCGNVRIVAMLYEPAQRNLLICAR